MAGALGDCRRIGNSPLSRYRGLRVELGGSAAGDAFAGCDRSHSLRSCPYEAALSFTTAGSPGGIPVPEKFTRRAMGSGSTRRNQHGQFTANSPVNMETASELDVLTNGLTTWTNGISFFTATSFGGLIEIDGNGGPFTPFPGDPTAGAMNALTIKLNGPVPGTQYSITGLDVTLEGVLSNVGSNGAPHALGTMLSGKDTIYRIGRWRGPPARFSRRRHHVRRQLRRYHRR